MTRNVILVSGVQHSDSNSLYVMLMDKEDVEYQMVEYYRILHSHRKGWDCAICNNTNGRRRYYAKRNKSDWKGQTPYDCTHMWHPTSSARYLDYSHHCLLHNMLLQTFMYTSLGTHLHLFLLGILTLGVEILGNRIYI